VQFIDEIQRKCRTIDHSIRELFSCPGVYLTGGAIPQPLEEISMNNPNNPNQDQNPGQTGNPKPGQQGGGQKPGQQQQGGQKPDQQQGGQHKPGQGGQDR
jgi:hypothetical protein